MTTGYSLITQDELAQRLDFFEQECRRRGLRVTEQRREIFKAVAASHSHPSAEDVFAQVREKLANVSLDTVYRTLTSLEDMELLLRVGTEGKERFDGDLRPHAHFVCTACGGVYDIFPDEGERIIWPASAVEKGTVQQVNVQLRGICKKCQQAGKI